jgi:hypothetical protein
LRYLFQTFKTTPPSKFDELGKTRSQADFQIRAAPRRLEPAPTRRPGPQKSKLQSVGKKEKDSPCFRDLDR